MSSTMASPPYVAPPPTKKQRSVAPGASRVPDDAIARRRAELRLLQQRRAPAVGQPTVLAMARNQLGGGAGFDRNATTTAAAARPPSNIPSHRQTASSSVTNVPQSKVQVRNSDIFPHAPKLADSPLPPKTPQLARTLEFQSPGVSPESPHFLESTASSRAKSAPPQRPPPPPAGRVSATHRAPPRDRTRVERPPPTPLYPKSQARVEARKGLKSQVNGTRSATEPVVNGQSPAVNSNALFDPSQEVSAVPSLEDEPATDIPAASELFTSNGSGPKSKVNENKHETAAPAANRRADKTRQSPPDTREEKKESNDLRLVSELRQAEDAKKDALRRVAQLEAEIHEWEESNRKKKTPTESFEMILQLADTEGAAAAVSWAREQLGAPTPKQSFSQVGFLSPVNGSATPSPMSPFAAAHPPVRKRVATPHPKRQKNKGAGLPEPEDDLVWLTESTKAVPHEYFSPLATYIVRQPFQSNEDILWSTAGTTPLDVYRDAINVTKACTFEILAHILADNSTLTLKGDSTLRHTLQDGSWKVFHDVDDTVKPLGCVMYIDGDANECEYRLDDIYEEALAAREAYCSSLVSTASALRASQANGVGPRREEEVLQSKPPLMNGPQTVDASVSTDDLDPAPKRREPTPKAARQANAQKPSPKKVSAEKRVEPPEEEEDASSDVFSAMMAMLISAVFSLIWLVLVRIPLKLARWTITFVVIYAVGAAVWLWLADDHGASAMGAGVDKVFYIGVY